MEVKGQPPRKGCRREAGSEGSGADTCGSMDKNRIPGVSVGRAANLPRSPYPSRTRSVDPAIVHGQRVSLSREICPVSPRSPAATEAAARPFDRRAEVSRRHSRSWRRQGLRGTPRPKGGVNGEAEPGTVAEGPNERSGE